MSLLGKILLFVNLLAAGGLIYAANQDWARRQSITANVLQHFLVLAGMPFEAPGDFDDEDMALFPVETSGGHVTQSVRKNIVRNYLKGAEGGERYGVGAGSDQSTVTTQLAELNRVEEKLDAQVRAADPTARLEMLCGRYQGTQFTPGLLVRLAESFEERELIRAAAKLPEPRDPAIIAERVAKAEAILKRKFDAVKAQPNPKLAVEYAEQVRASAEKLRGLLAPRQDAHAKLLRAQAARNNADIAAAEQEVKTSDDALKAAAREFADVLAGGGTPAAARDDADRRRRAAHLLVLLDKSADWQNRVAKVIGLKAYHTAVVDQTSRLQDIARSVQRQIESDQASFVDQYEQLKNLALDRADLALKQEAIQKVLTEQAARDAEAVAQRTAELSQRRQLLAEVKSEVAAKLAAQAEVEKELFEVQKKVGNTLRLNFDLEDKLDKVETEAARP